MPETELDLLLSDTRLRVQTKEKNNEKITKEDYLALGLLYLRRFKGWKRPNLTIRLKINDRRLVEWEKGEKFPPMHVLELIKKVLKEELKASKM